MYTHNSVLFARFGVWLLFAGLLLCVFDLCGCMESCSALYLSAHCLAHNNTMAEGEGISTLSCVCVCVNMMIGAGFLALPQGFLHGGIVASICKCVCPVLGYSVFES